MKNSYYTFGITMVGSVIVAMVVVPFFVYGQGEINTSLLNPIKAKSLYCFLRDIIDIILTIGVVIASFFIIYAGFLMVTARGDETKLQNGKNALLGAVIGTALLLGVYGIANAIIGTVDAIRGTTTTTSASC